MQHVCARAVEQLRRETGCERMGAWTRLAGDDTLLLAGHDGAGIDYRPQVDVIDALADGPARDLAGCEAPGLAGARAAGFTAGAAVLVDGRGAAILLLGGSEDPVGAVRPRTLATLGAVADRLVSPLAASHAASRLAELDGTVQKLDRLSALGSIVAEIVHEIRNPLVSVKTFLQLLPERVEDPEFREEFHAVASEELRRVERLLDLVLSHARPGPDPRETEAGEIAPALDSVRRLLAHRAADAGVALQPAPAEEEAPAVALSDDGLRQVFLNLTLNAIEVTPHGGGVRFGWSASGESVEIRIEDGGPGVPSALRDRIFEPFFSSKPERPGGLGLAISRRIVEGAGGRLEVAARRPGPGACFRIQLPRATAAPG